MGKGGFERAVPLVEPLQTALAAYDSPQGRADAYFPKYGTTRGANNASATLRYLLREQAKIKDTNLVPYSLRHTLKDRLAQSGMETAKAEYLLGHRSTGSSRVHEQYGTMPPPKLFQASMNRLIKTDTWGYFED